MFQKDTKDAMIDSRTTIVNFVVSEAPTLFCPSVFGLGSPLVSHSRLSQYPGSIGFAGIPRLKEAEAIVFGLRMDSYERPSEMWVAVGV